MSDQTSYEVRRIKPLDWGSTSYGRPEAITIAGVYRIIAAWNGGWSVSRNNVGLPGEDGRTNFPTIEGAKAAAQSDFDERILSAIEFV